MNLVGGILEKNIKQKKNEAERNDSDFKYVAAWGYNKNGKPKLV